MTGPDAYAVRPAVEADLLAVLRLLARADEGRGVEPTAPTTTEQAMWDRMMATEDVTVYLAETATGAGDTAGPTPDVVATATFLVLPNITYGCRPTGFVEAVVTAARHRRQGLAARIMRRLLADARALGCHKIQLLAHKNHAFDGAHDFYRSLGFEAEAEGFRLYLGER